jgi:hypothetical protein
MTSNQTPVAPTALGQVQVLTSLNGALDIPSAVPQLGLFISGGKAAMSYSTGLLAGNWTSQFFFNALTSQTLANFGQVVFSPSGVAASLLQLELGTSGTDGAATTQDGIFMNASSTNHGCRLIRFAEAGVGQMDFFYDHPGQFFGVSGGGVPFFGVTLAGDVWAGGKNSVLDQSATTGFFGIPNINGAPSGTPASHDYTIPMCYDATNHKIWVYDTGVPAWKGVAVV